MQAGRMDRRITLQRPTDVIDAAGGASQTWQDVATVWASRRDIRARELVAADTKLADTEAVFTIYHRADVRPRWRLLEGGRVYEVTGTAEIGRREGLEIRCTAWVTG